VENVGHSGSSGHVSRSHGPGGNRVGNHHNPGSPADNPKSSTCGLARSPEVLATSVPFRMALETPLWAPMGMQWWVGLGRSSVRSRPRFRRLLRRLW
jgi:hypothetical protein